MIIDPRILQGIGTMSLHFAAIEHAFATILGGLNYDDSPVENASSIVVQPSERNPRKGFEYWDRQTIGPLRKAMLKVVPANWVHREMLTKIESFETIRHALIHGQMMERLIEIDFSTLSKFNKRTGALAIVDAASMEKMNSELEAFVKILLPALHYDISHDPTFAEMRPRPVPQMVVTS
jgi:hypothetical protein